MNTKRRYDRSFKKRAEVVACVVPGERNRRLPWWAYVIALIFLVGGAI